MIRPSHFAILLSLLLITPASDARIISYAPVTSEFSRPAIQERNSQSYMLLESKQPFTGGVMMFPGPPAQVPRGGLVIHDATGKNEPREILSRREPVDVIEHAAMHVTDDGTRHVLAVMNETSGVQGPALYFYSRDDGESWTKLSLPEGLRTEQYFREDVGGPVVRGRGAQIRLGNSQTPFVFAAYSYSPSRTNTVIYGIDRDGSVRQLVELELNSKAYLIGSDLQGDRFLITGRPITNGTAKPNGIRILHLDGRLENVLITDAVHSRMEAWITADGSVYLDEVTNASQHLSLIRGGQRSTMVEVPPRVQQNSPVLLATQAHDFEGVWVVVRKTGEPTELFRHRLDGAFERMWSDLTGPEVEAVHPAASGERLLIQVHRERVAPDALIIDPALAIWEIGSAAPRRYDELFLNEGAAKAFVSLDVDAVAEGGSFVFDSAATELLPPPELSASPGGGEISQEWGVVRASLHQKLVLPALARLPGAFGSYWKSDVMFFNGESEPLRVALRFAPTGGGQELKSQIILAAKELRLIEDALFELFGLESGGGALFITPEAGRAVAVSSRLYTESEEGTYGMGVNAVDVYSAASSRYFLSFAGGFQGSGSRTNLLITDAQGNGGRFGVQASGPTGLVGRTDAAWDVPAAGQIQINHLAGELGAMQQAAARFEVLGGWLIPSLVSIDNVTNDPTMFPPDVVAGAVRMIPIIGHLDGANGSKFRTDLYLYNSSNLLKNVRFSAKPLDSNESETVVTFTLLPFESKLIPDVYKTAFAKEGTGRLRFQSGQQAETEGVRVSARIYTEAPDGGTYGFVMPALNAFQSAGPGESLEIIGAVIDERFRTNLALVDTAAFSNGGVRRVRVEVFGTGRELLDSFETQVRVAGGMQIADLFTNRGFTSDSSKPVIIRVSPLDGLVGAFATLIDNRTNDPMYLGAGLLSQ